MPAGFLLRRAAGMKNGGALLRRNAGKLQFLERRRRHGGNLCPVFDRLWRATARPADFPVGGVAFKLKREQLQGEFGELPIVDCRLPIGNQSAQARGEAGKFFVHAVFVHGWFSATANKKTSMKAAYGKGIDPSKVHFTLFVSGSHPAHGSSPTTPSGAGNRKPGRALKNALKEDRIIVIIDESGLSQKPHRVRTWAPCGKTPVLEFDFNWKKLSVIGGIAVWNFYFQFYPGTIKSPQVIEFLKHLQQQLPSKLLVIWDGAMIHRSRLVGNISKAFGDRFIPPRSRLTRPNSIPPNMYGVISNSTACLTSPPRTSPSRRSAG